MDKMDAALDYLKDWAQRYILHRDINTKKISGITNSSQGFVVANRDGTSTNCFVLLSLKGFNPKEIAPGQKSTIVFTLSNAQNIHEVHKAWDSLIQNPNLVLIFVNPFSGSEEKWTLKPYLHNQVCDRASLLLGLKAMAELVEPIDEETLLLNARRQR